MKLSDIKGEEALDVLADIIDPITDICTDSEFKAMIDAKKPKLLAVKYLLKNHKKDVLTVLAIINQKDVNTFKPNLIELPMMVLDVLNDEEVMKLFQYAEVEKDSDFSTPAMEITKGIEKE